MDAESARQLLIPYMDGKLDPDTIEEVDQLLAAHPALRLELSQLRELAGLLANGESIEVDAAMRERFGSFLKREMAQTSADGTPNRPGSLIAFPPVLRAAAAIVIVAAGVSIAWLLRDRSENPKQPASTVMVDSASSDPSGYLASARLEWISRAEQSVQLEPDLVDALLKIVADDPNAAVRLAALEALGRSSDIEPVRRRLIELLSKEADPMVQIALIGILAETGAPDAYASIEQLLRRPDVRGVVKGRAQRGLTYD